VNSKEETLKTFVRTLSKNLASGAYTCTQTGDFNSCKNSVAFFNYSIIGVPCTGFSVSELLGKQPNHPEAEFINVQFR
jgi:hypothetical protein